MICTDSVIRPCGAGNARTGRCHLSLGQDYARYETKEQSTRSVVAD
ncbi:MAG: hypothetical protein GY861_13410 [bacterium]|nr:hypothetical protein [bacterium]